MEFKVEAIETDDLSDILLELQSNPRPEHPLWSITESHGCHRQYSTLVVRSSGEWRHYCLDEGENLLL